jgi:hypothetical protein
LESRDRDQLVRSLLQMPSAAWEGFMASAAGRDLRLQALRDSLAGTSQGAEFVRAATSTRVSRLLGCGVMQDAHCGAWVCEKLLNGAPRRAWVRAIEECATLNNRKTVEVRRNASQRRKAPALIAVFWHEGSSWAMNFYEIFGLLAALWQRRGGGRVEDEEIVPSEPLPPPNYFNANRR